MLMLRSAAKTDVIWMLVTAFWMCFGMTSSETVWILELLSVLAAKDYLKTLIFVLGNEHVGMALH